MNPIDVVVSVTMAIVLIVGGYQFYFWCQRRTKGRARTFTFAVDKAIPLRAGWVWIYSGLYYPAIGFVVISAQDFRHFSYMAFSYLMLLALHAVTFLVFPVEVPSDWRLGGTDGASISRKFLAFVQHFDARSNCFPSLHVSVATLTGLHIGRNIPSLSLCALAFVALITLSCIFTKQHYIVDLPPAVVLGWVSFKVFLRLTTAV